MIAVIPNFRRGLRNQTLTSLPATVVKSLPLVPERQRFYIVVSFKCNAKCAYCLFRFEDLAECPKERLFNRVGAVLRANPKETFSLSVTGGEPFLQEARVKTVLDSVRRHAWTGQVRWIGFGTNATGKPPLYLNDYGNLPIHVYISRHHYDPDVNASIFGRNDLLSVVEYQRQLPLVRVKMACNMIGGGIDSLDGIKRMLDWAGEAGITDVTFRQLNSISGQPSMYSHHVQDYISWYKTHLITLTEILLQVEKDPEFTFLAQDIRPFIYHERWQRKGITITFRNVVEVDLIKHSDSITGIDEFVLHPDGLLTGCWDRDRKILITPEEDERCLADHLSLNP